MDDFVNEPVSEVATVKINELIPSYRDYLEHERKLSKATQASYTSDLRALARFVDKDVQAITRRDLRAFMRHLSKQGKCANTVRRVMHGLGTFWKWLYVEGHVSSVETQYLELPRKNVAAPTWMNETELRRFVAAAEQDGVPLRESVAWRLLAYTGMRPDELRRLTVENVKLETAAVIVRNTKSKQDRVLPLHESLIGDLARLIEGKAGGEYVFANRYGRIWKRLQMIEAFQRQLERADLTGRGYTMYTLRHTCGTLMALNGTPIHVIKDWLGHKDLSTTQVYLHAAPSNLRAAMARHPLAKDESDARA